MARPGHLIHLATTAIFVVSGILLILGPQPGLGIDRLSGVPGAASLSPYTPAGPPLAGFPLPNLFLYPANIVMWALLLALWAAVLMDAVGQWLDPSDHGPAPAWPRLSACLLLGAAWPWFYEQGSWVAVIGSVAAAVAGYVAALRSVGQRRPAIGFLAGWSLGVATSVLAERIGEATGIGLAPTAILAILPAAVLGMAGQIFIGRAIGFSVALIWTFCGLATTTMGFSPMTAIAAILGIAAMATVLIRAAS